MKKLRNLTAAITMALVVVSYIPFIGPGDAYGASTSRDVSKLLSTDVTVIDGDKVSSKDVPYGHAYNEPFFVP